jgi:chemotaxis protein MotB
MKKHAHHGGAWKVAYADFVTAMMALFLVLWLTAQDTRIKEAVERAFRNPFSSATKESMGIIPNKDVQATHEEKGSFDSASAMQLELLRRITEDLAKMLQQDDDSQNSVKIAMTSDGLRINVYDRSTKPVFEGNSSEFTHYGDWVFSTLAWEISRYPTFAIELEGHTEMGSPARAENYGSWELSSDRANAARRKLLVHGVVATQIKKVAGLADTEPMPDADPKSEINRRVTVVLKVKDGSRINESSSGSKASS